MQFYIVSLSNTSHTQQLVTLIQGHFCLLSQHTFPNEMLFQNFCIQHTVSHCLSCRKLQQLILNEMVPCKETVRKKYPTAHKIVTNNVEGKL